MFYCNNLRLIWDSFGTNFWGQLFGVIREFLEVIWEQFGYNLGLS